MFWKKSPVVVVKFNVPTPSPIPDIIIVVRTTEYFYGSTIVKANGIRIINYFWLLLFNSYNALVKYLTLSFYRRFVTSSMLTTLRRKSTFESKKILERLSSFECLNPYRLFLKEKIYIMSTMVSRCCTFDYKLLGNFFCSVWCHKH